MKIAVTGLGVISSIGNNLSGNLHSLKQGKGGITQFTEADRSFYSGRVTLTNTELMDLLDIPNHTTVNRSTLLGMIAAREAWAKRTHHSELRTGIISGTTYGQTDLTDVLLSTNPETQTVLLKMHDNGSSTELIAHDIGIQDHRSTISTACSSSANAIMLGARLIESGALDRVLVGGSDSVNAFTLIGFNSLLLYDTERCRPFDENRNGLNLGEAGAFLVLESERSLQITQEKKLAEIRGWANTCDSFHPTGSSPEGKGASLAILKALKKANLETTDIDHINAHGTGTKNNDLSESMAMQHVFGKNIPPFCSTKSYTGHTLAAAGGLEAVYSILSLQNDLVFPNLNHERNMKEVSFSPEKQLLTNKKIDTVLSSSFGFGGNCTELIFSK